MTCTNESWEITIQTGCKLPAQRSTHDAPGDRGPSHSPCLCLSSRTGDDGGVFLVRGEPPSQPPSTASWDSSFWLLRSQNTSHWLKSLLFPRSPLFWGEGGGSPAEPVRHSFGAGYSRMHSESDGKSGAWPVSKVAHHKVFGERRTLLPRLRALIPLGGLAAVKAQQDQTPFQSSAVKWGGRSASRAHTTSFRFLPPRRLISWQTYHGSIETASIWRFPFHFRFCQGET